MVVQPRVCSITAAVRGNVLAMGLDSSTSRGVIAHDIFALPGKLVLALLANIFGRWMPVLEFLGS